MNWKFFLIEWSTGKAEHWDITILNIYSLTTSAPNFIKEILLDKVID